MGYIDSFLVNRGKLVYNSVLFMIIIILEDFGTQSVGSSSSSDSSEQDVNSTDDSDSEASDSDSEASDPEELLHFPDPD